MIVLLEGLVCGDFMTALVLVVRGDTHHVNRETTLVETGKQQCRKREAITRKMLTLTQGSGFGHHINDEKFCNER